MLWLAAYVLVAPPAIETDHDSTARAAPVPTIVYLNRDGGTFQPGRDDARENRSSIVDAPSTIPAWDVDDAGWDQVAGCLEDLFLRWNVTVTDEDPGDVPHLEAVIAGRPSDLGLTGNIGGIAPFRTDCGIVDGAVVYAFAEQYGDNLRGVCETAAQEIAHAFGLDHQMLCSDPMSYLGGCGPKAFQDVDAPCGEFEERACACGGDTQNSIALLDARLGVAGEAPSGGPADSSSPTVEETLGCSAGGAPGLLAGLAALGLARRRRRR